MSAVGVDSATPSVCASPHLIQVISEGQRGRTLPQGFTTTSSPPPRSPNRSAPSRPSSPSPPSRSSPRASPAHSRASGLPRSPPCSVDDLPSRLPGFAELMLTKVPSIWQSPRVCGIVCKPVCKPSARPATETSVSCGFAGVAQWQSRSFPSLRRGFDSLHPLQRYRNFLRWRLVGGQREPRGQSTFDLILAPPLPLSRRAEHDAVHERA